MNDKVREWRIGDRVYRNAADRRATYRVISNIGFGNDVVLRDERTGDVRSAPPHHLVAVPSDPGWVAEVLRVHGRPGKEVTPWTTSDARRLTLKLHARVGNVGRALADAVSVVPPVDHVRELAAARIYLELLARCLFVDLNEACRAELGHIYNRFGVEPPPTGEEVQ